MSRPALRKISAVLLVFLAVWLGQRYLLPILLPFLLGTGLAFAAEPVTGFFERRFRLKRGAAAGIGVTVAMVMFLGLLVLLGGLMVRELGALAGVLPDLEDTAAGGLLLLEDFLVGIASRAPDGLRPLLSKMVLDLFSGGSALLDQVTRRIPGMASAVLSRIPDGALGLGTGILSGFMISVRLPKIKHWIGCRLPEAWRETYLPALGRMRRALWGWFQAQAKLAGVTFLILTAGFLVLQISYAPVWGVLVALVDAAPILGTGTVLIPWSLVCALQGNYLRAAGLLGTYAVAALTRSVLEPRLVGRQLGLDPLVTLAALYTGYQLWGIWGMLAAPMLAAAAMELAGMERR